MKVGRIRREGSDIEQEGRKGGGATHVKLAKFCNKIRKERFGDFYVRCGAEIDEHHQKV